MGKAPSHKKGSVMVPKWATEQDAFNRTKKFPGCAGTFPDCPENVTKESVPDACRLCPMYRK